MSRRGGRLNRLIKKELREILRDRRTIFTLVLMPLLVYPMLNLVFQRYLLTSLTLDQPPSGTIRIGFDEPAQAANLAELIRFGNRELQATSGQSGAGQQNSGSARSKDVNSLAEEETPRERVNFEIEVVSDLKAALREGFIDLGVRIEDPQASSFRIELLYVKGAATGRRAYDMVTTAFAARNASVHSRLVQFLRSRGADAPELVTTTQAEIKATSGPSMLSSLVPLILIMMTVTGAVYPAIDLTAGERERATLETLLAAPVSRLGLLLAKYTAVVTVAMLTALVNLTAMAATIYSGGLSTLVFGDDGLTLGAVISVLLLLLLFAAFFSAVLLMITSSARSFKEAQAYLIPLMLVSLGPGLISLLPGIELTAALAATPLINVVLLARDIFMGEPLGPTAAVAVITTIGYTFLAISLAARVFGRDAVSQASDTTTRRAVGAWTSPTPQFSLIGLGMLLPVYFFLGGWLARQQDISLPIRLVIAAIVTAVIFGLLPALACIWERVPIRLGMRLRPAGWIAFVAAGLIGISAWPFAHELVLLGNRLGIYTLSSGQLERVAEMLNAWREQLPLPLLLVCLAATPALFEELFFRGYFFRAWESQLGAWKTIALTSVLFGAFHVISGHQLTPERFLPSAFLGMLLGIVAWRSGSVWPGVLLHISNNGLLLLMAYYQDDLIDAGIGVQEATSLPAWWLGAAFIGCGIGLASLRLTSPGESARLATASAK